MMNTKQMLIQFILLICCTFSAVAHDNNSAKWQWHGFIAQGLVDVNGSNFVSNDKSLSTELTELGINASYNIEPNLRLAGQIVYLDGGNRYHKGTRIDYLLLDWAFYNQEAWQAHLYLGRFKNVHWLYSSTRDIPFARPSIILPQSVYFDGFRDIAVGGDGGALKISHSDDEHGDIDFNVSYGTSPVSKEQGQLILGKLALGKVQQDFDLQASLYWRPTFSAWRIGASILDSDFSYKQSPSDFYSDGDFSFKFYTLNALYEGEVWEFSGEVFQEDFTIKGFYLPNFNKVNIGQGYYFQTRYRLNADLRFLARYEYFYADRDDKKGKKLEQATGGLIPAYFAFQNDFVLGASYDITNNLKVRIEHHWVDGTARLSPVVQPNPLINNKRYWQMFAMQLMYWF